jgi:hypothetical protein
MRNLELIKKYHMIVKEEVFDRRKPSQAGRGEIRG